MALADTDGINPAYDEQSGYDTSDDRYPPDWTSRAKAIRKRDDYICQDCGFKSGYHAAEGKGATLDVHHITFLKDGGSNRESNLTTLCVECHNNRHDYDITDGRNYTPKPTPGLGDLLHQAIRSLLGGIPVLLLHCVMLTLFLTQSSDSPLYLVGLAYLIALVVGVALRPRQTTGFYIGAGVVGLALLQLIPLSISESVPVHPRSLVLSAFIVAFFAGAWWWPQRRWP